MHTLVFHVEDPRGPSRWPVPGRQTGPRLYQAFEPGHASLARWPSGRLAFTAASDTVSTPTAAGAFPVGWSLPGPFPSQASC